MQLRTEYLDLLLSIIKNSTYNESNHRLSEIVSILHRIENEDTETEENQDILNFDKKIVCNILKELAVLKN